MMKHPLNNTNIFQLLFRLNCSGGHFLRSERENFKDNKRFPVFNTVMVHIKIFLKIINVFQCLIQ